MNKDRLSNNLLAICLLMPIFILMLIILGLVKHSETSSSIEENKTIDSIKEVNKIIVIEVNKLDSTKNEEIIKVKELDNDSTLKLFYELLGK